jgi:CRP-like cAMP-binding protein
MQYLLKKIVYKRNHVLYEEGISIVDGVYLVVEGEFEVS